MDVDSSPTGVGGTAGTGAQERRAVAEEWDRRYGAEERLFRADPDETLVELARALKAGTAVDLGAGEGRNALWLAGQGWQVTAVDASEVALGRLEASAAGLGLETDVVAGDLHDFLREAGETGRSFDLVVVAFVHPPAAERARLLAAAAGALSPGGHLFVVAHHRDSLGQAGPPDPERLYAEEDLEQLGDGLVVRRLERRTGVSDVAHHGVDVFLWAERPQRSLAATPNVK